MYFPFTLQWRHLAKFTKENLYKSPGKSPYLALCLQPGVYFASHGTFRTPLKNHDTAWLLISPAPPLAGGSWHRR